LIHAVLGVALWDLDSALKLLKPDETFLKPFVTQVIERSSKFRPVPKAIFVAAKKRLPLSIGRNMWGECTGEYPFSVAIEVTGQPESLIHECLHIFGLSEGYDPSTQITFSECRKCWMQYEAIYGEGLCDRHLNEFRNFMDALEA
jgi:hypothetical protein